MAKELLHTRKAIKQLYTNKAQMVAMNATLSEQLATVKSRRHSQQKYWGAPNFFPFIQVLQRNYFNAEHLQQIRMSTSSGARCKHIWSSQDCKGLELFKSLTASHDIQKALPVSVQRFARHDRGFGWVVMLTAWAHFDTLQVMNMMNDLIKIPQLNRTMAEMSREMMKAGMIDEIMDDAIDSALDSEDMEEETEAEIDKVLIHVVHSPSEINVHPYRSL